MEKYKILVLSVLISVLLAACGAGGNGGGEAAAEPAAEPAAAAAEDAPAEDAPAAEAPEEGVIEITAWEMYGPGRNMDQLSQEFNEMQSDIFVNHEFIPGHDVLIQNLVVTAAAGTDIPDVILVDMFYAPFVHELVGNVDLRPFIDADPTMDFNDFYDNLRDYSFVDGRQISIHAYANNIILFYNRSHFEEAGLDPYSPPRSWDDLIHYAVQLTTNDRWGFNCDSFGGGYYEFPSWTFQTLVWQNGGETWDENWQPLFNSPEGIGALQHMVDMIHTYEVATTAPPANGFQQGLISMMRTGTWMSGSFLEALGDDLMAAPLPYSVRPATNIGGEHWMITQSDPVTEAAAWEYVSFFLSEHAFMLVNNLGGLVPTRVAISESDAFQEWAARCPGTRASLESMPFGRMRAATYRYAAASEAKSDYLERALFGVMSVEDAVAGAAAAFANAINQ